MKKKLKEFQKEAMVLTGTGIGLGVGASVMSEAGASAVPISKLSKGVGMAATLSTAKLSVGVLSDLNKDLKKKLRD